MIDGVTTVPCRHLLPELLTVEAGEGKRRTPYPYGPTNRKIANSVIYERGKGLTS